MNADYFRNGILQLIKSTDSTSQPFRDDVYGKILIYPTRGMALTEPQFSALSACGNPSQSAYCVPTEFADQPSAISMEEAVKFQLDDYEGYLAAMREAGMEMETLVVLDNFQGGVLISQEYYGIVGGSKQFISRFRDNYPDHNDDLPRFVSAMNDYAQRSGVCIAWLPSLLESITSFDHRGG